MDEIHGCRLRNIHDSLICGLKRRNQRVNRLRNIRDSLISGLKQRNQRFIIEYLGKIAIWPAKLRLEIQALTNRRIWFTVTTHDYPVILPFDVSAASVATRD
jgi:hypothetical protein